MLRILFSFIVSLAFRMLAIACIFGLFMMCVPKMIEDSNNYMQAYWETRRKSQEFDRYPVQFESPYCYKMIPYLTVKMNDRNTIKTIMPGNTMIWNYTIDKLIYFRNEPDPIGFCLSLTNNKGSSEVLLFHRDRGFFHSKYRDRIRFVEGGTFEDIQGLMFRLSDNSLHHQNYLYVEVADDYSELPVHPPQRHKDNNSKESWLEAFAIVSEVAKDMQEITEPAVTGMVDAFSEIKK